MAKEKNEELFTEKFEELENKVINESVVIDFGSFKLDMRKIYDDISINTKVAFYYNKEFIKACNYNFNEVVATLEDFSYYYKNHLEKIASDNEEIRKQKALKSKINKEIEMQLKKIGELEHSIALYDKLYNDEVPVFSVKNEFDKLYKVLDEIRYKYPNTFGKHLDKETLL